MKNMLLVSSAFALGMAATTAHAEPQAEVLHWWTSGGEAAAVKVLMEEFEENGGTWTDMPVAGGGGDAAMTALRARVLSGNAPTAVQLKVHPFKNGMKKALWAAFKTLPKRKTGTNYCLQRFKAT